MEKAFIHRSRFFVAEPIYWLTLPLTFEPDASLPIGLGHLEGLCQLELLVFDRRCDLEVYTKLQNPQLQLHWILGITERTLPILPRDQLKIVGIQILSRGLAE
jgi:hypothetical protein